MLGFAVLCAASSVTVTCSPAANRNEDLSVRPTVGGFSWAACPCGSGAEERAAADAVEDGATESLRGDAEPDEGVGARAGPVSVGDPPGVSEWRSRGAEYTATRPSTTVTTVPLDFL